MIKDHLKSKNISIYALAKSSGVPYSTLNDLVNGKVQIDSVKVGVVRRVAKALGLTIDELYDMCKGKELSFATKYDIPIKVSVRNKSYNVSFIYKGEPVEIELCKVNKDTDRYIEQIAIWRSESYIREKRMEDPWNIS